MKKKRYIFITTITYHSICANPCLLAFEEFYFFVVIVILFKPQNGFVFKKITNFCKITFLVNTFFYILRQTNRNSSCILHLFENEIYFSKQKKKQVISKVLSQSRFSQFNVALYTTNFQMALL